MIGPKPDFKFNENRLRNQRPDHVRDLEFACHSHGLLVGKNVTSISGPHVQSQNWNISIIRCDGIITAQKAHNLPAVSKCHLKVEQMNEPIFLSKQRSQYTCASCRSRNAESLFARKVRWSFMCYKPQPGASFAGLPAARSGPAAKAPTSAGARGGRRRGRIGGSGDDATVSGTLYKRISINFPSTQKNTMRRANVL